MRTHSESRLTRIILVAFFLAIIGYGAYELRGLILGPVINIEQNVVETTEQFITIEGHAARIATLTMNGFSIPVTEDGSFSEGYVLSPGYNRVVLEARDRYGNSARKEIQIIYRPASLSVGTTTTQ